MKLANIFDTDPLALGALVGLGAVLIVSVGIFYFLLFHKDRRPS